MTAAAPSPCSARAAISSGSVRASADEQRAGDEDDHAGAVDARGPAQLAERGEREQRCGHRELEPLTTQIDADGSACSSRAIVGSAVFAIEPSSTDIAIAIASAR